MGEVPRRSALRAGPDGRRHRHLRPRRRTAESDVQHHGRIAAALDHLGSKPAPLERGGRSDGSPQRPRKRPHKRDTIAPVAMGEFGIPGEFPFTRGIQPTMYRGRLWTMRQYAGFGTAAESNAATGISWRRGSRPERRVRSADADGLRLRPSLAAGEVGRVGVAIDSIEDMAALFDGIPLDACRRR